MTNITKVDLATRVKGVLPVGTSIEADLYKYSIVTSVASGNLTVALKNYLGNDPTVAAPVKIQIGGVIRTITAALSNTLPGGNGSIMNLGSAELATKEVDLFPYLGWVSDAIVIGYSRIPYATTGNDFDFSGVTAEKWARFSAQPGTTDPVTNIGRFNAILSAGAGYTWSIPATSVIVNQSIYSTRRLNSNTVWTGFSANPGASFEYQIIGSKVFWAMIDSSSGTSNSTSFTLTAPFSPANSKTALAQVFVTNNGSINTTPGHLACTGGSNIITVGQTYYNGGWTNANAKNVAWGEISYNI